MTDEALHAEILELRQEYVRNTRPQPVVLPDALVRALALREDENLTWRDIADRLNDEGFRTLRGKPWSAANIWNQLTHRGLYFERISRTDMLREKMKDHPRDYHGRWQKK